MRDELTARPNYEAMYDKLCEEHKKLCADHSELDREYRALEAEFGRLRAQIDIVHLIFGK